MKIFRSEMLVFLGQIFEVLVHHSSEGRTNYVFDLDILVIMPRSEMPCFEFWPDQDSFWRLCVVGGTNSTQPLVSISWSSVPLERRSSLRVKIYNKEGNVIT
jgi:hypothetical protein